MQDNGDPYDPHTPGYAYTDYGPTVYTDIDPNSPPGYWSVTPWQEPFRRVNGLLKQGMTRIAECTDGLSNTVAVAEDAGKDERYVSTYIEYQPLIQGGDPRGNGPYPGYPQPGYQNPYYVTHRFWRWADPDIAIGVSGQPNNPTRPEHEVSAWTKIPFPGPPNTAGNKAGNNDALASFHPGGVNAVFGDGSVRFITDSIYPPTLRDLINLNGAPGRAPIKIGGN
jgi:prepilin-type processing-associated H-X9-DG protein